MRVTVKEMFLRSKSIGGGGFALRNAASYLKQQYSVASGRRMFSNKEEAEKMVHLNFKNKEGDVTRVPAKVGRSILQVAHANDIPLEGACESSLACSTCHVILQNSVFDSLPEASEEEEDMLDLAFALTQTSRLGCQVFVTPDMDESVITLPAATRNFYIDGHVPKPH